MSESIQDFDVVENINEFDSDNDTEMDLSIDISKFGEAVIWGTDWTTETIAGQLIKGNIDLSPKFQRRDAWSNQEKSKLIESLMLGIPVPPIILAENREKKNSYIVIDGKQRLLSIRRFFAKDDGEDVFQPLKLSGLDILSSLNGKTCEQLRIDNNSYVDSVENQSIRAIVIKNWPDESFLYTVFLRLNTGSKRLSPQELRQALIPGPFLSYLDDKTADSESIRRMLGNSAPDSRMKDVELALRYMSFALLLNTFDGNLKKLMDDTCRIINSNWGKYQGIVDDLFQRFENAIDFAYEIMQDKSPFSRYSGAECNRRFNKNIFELFTFYFGDRNIQNLVRANRDLFVTKFIEMNNNTEFIDAVSGTTKDPRKMAVRFELFWNLLKDLSTSECIMSKHVAFADDHLKVEDMVL